MKKCIFLFSDIFIFDTAYGFLYEQFSGSIEPEFLKYPFILIHFLVSAPAVFADENLPFYAPIPVYQAVLIYFGNVIIQTFLIYTVLFKKKNPDKSI